MIRCRDCGEVFASLEAASTEQDRHACKAAAEDREPKLSAYDIEQIARQLWDSIEPPRRMKYLFLPNEERPKDGDVIRFADGSRWKAGHWVPIDPPLRRADGAVGRWWTMITEEPDAES